MIGKYLNRFLFSTKQAGGNLYTWGKNSGALGYSVSNQIQEMVNPQRVTGFDNNVYKVSLGNNHSAALTTDGSLYTFGSGKYGVLGHNDGETSHVQPKLVEFFNKNNLKVQDVHCGEYFTVALTTDGDVWTWGALGHGDNQSRYTPFPVEALRKLPPISQISGKNFRNQYYQAGYNFVNALNVNGELYNWGKGDYGVLGDGSNKSQYEPIKNYYFNFLQNEYQNKIIKIKSANNYSVVLMSDGHLYGWGSNESGQMGMKNEIGVEIFEVISDQNKSFKTANYPTPVVDEEFIDTQIKDFALGEDIMVLQTENNKVLWSGIRIAYKPEIMKIPADEQVKFIGACYRCAVAVTDQGNIYFKNEFTRHTSTNDNTGVNCIAVKELFQENGELLNIGGTNRNRFAIIEQ